MKFYIASRRDRNIYGLLKRAQISCNYDVTDMKEVGDCDNGIAIEIENLHDLGHIQARIESLNDVRGLEGSQRLVIDFIKQEIVIYDSYMD